MMNKKIKIIFSGGGSGGPVTPLLAVLADLKESGEDFEFLWVGTCDGIEREMVKLENIPYKAISSGKLRRYFDLKNFTDFFRIIKGYFESIFLIRKEKPGLIISAGAFVSVPLVWAAWVCRVPVLIHQQDARPGLANKLMAPFARVITTTFEKSLKDYGEKAKWIGNPIRKDFLAHKISRREASQKFGLRSDKPILAVLGGGTGAISINNLIKNNVTELTKFCQIIHVTGKGKADKENDKLMETIPNYKYFEWMDKFGMIKLFTVADVVISRCGMSTLTELSQIGLVSALIPMPDSHQEENAEIFKNKNAAFVYKDGSIDDKQFVEDMKKLIQDEELRIKLSENIREVMKGDANGEMVKIIKNII